MTKPTDYILVLDSNAEARSHITGQLHQEGYTVYAANSPESALRIIKQARKGGTPCQLVLLGNNFGSAQRNQALNVLKRLRRWKGFKDVLVLGAALPGVQAGSDPKAPQPNLGVWARVVGKDLSLHISTQTFRRNTAETLWDIRDVLQHLTRKI
ncbi:MAG: hypothetical protein DI585_03105 [Pseudomonas fluorescens]|nr:MAG: hypothetical protein DI585_03105 [Pseudomonas fluorescens]